MKLKNTLLSIVGLFLFALSMQAQTPAYRIKAYAVAPAYCTPLNGDVFTLTGPGPVGAVYSCTAPNTWTLLGTAPAGVWIDAQGIIVASTPFIQQTAIWNNAAVTFVNDFSNITDTASAAASLLIQKQVGGNDIFTVSKTGAVGTAAAGNFNFLGRSVALSAADGRLNVTNAARTDFSGLTLGPEAVTNTRIAESATVAGQAQGIILLRGDGTAQTQANLGAATNGSMIYCSDCTIASPCANGGTGAIAKRLNGVWVCN